MAELEVAVNYGRDLIYKLQEEGILQKNPEYEECIIERGYEDMGACFKLFEGKDNWYVLAEASEMQEEVIIPKKVSKDTALLIAEQIIGEKYCEELGEYFKSALETDLKNCMDEYVECLEIFSREECADQYLECTHTAKQKYNEGANITERVFCDTSKVAELDLRRRGIKPINCVSGEEIGSKDIDQICFFVIPRFELL